ncbi:uncharacterized protein Dana_GF21200 [Drosophila ananassae]|uniref:Single domain-containing protein n=1 Tax=Drosophila ananassae TaxID=7217 RepID=B3MU35_DROAN|nr:uncharacterized protein LOC26515194 isoform X3 [Drosophila ananassae]EDV33364.1 uncharacterized protein Dana_GF21200 [Drosophila ananassae]
MSASFWLLSITLLSSLLIAAKAAEWQGLYSHPDHPGKCTISPKLILDPGVSIKDPTHDCRQIVCGMNGWAVFHSCGVSIPHPPCRNGDYMDPELPYPECCTRTLFCN